MTGYTEGRKTEDMAILEVGKLSAGYGNGFVIRDVSLAVEPGEFVAILGRNGSGKSTLIKAVQNLLENVEGTVRCAGENVFGLTPRQVASRIAYVSQMAEPAFEFTVEEIVRMGRFARQGRIEGSSAGDDAAVEAAMRLTEVDGFGGKPLSQLSGGEQQRVFIARAIVNRPRILFLDEPTVGVDAATQRGFYELLDLLNRGQGMTIVLVTHDIGIVDRHVNRVACLNRRLVYHGTHEEFCSAELARGLVAGGDHLVLHRH